MKQDTIELEATYHIFNRGNNRENIFIEDKNYSYFLDLLKRHILPIADIYAYCLLKNHFHLLLKIKDGKYFIKALGYIHLNPVKHGFTDNFRDYPYSSYKAFVSNRKSNIDKETVFGIVDKESFEYWHHHRVMGLEDIMDL